MAKTYTNGKEEKRIKDGEQPPEGWWPGLSDSHRERLKHIWDDKELLKSREEKRKKTTQDRYGVDNVFQSKDVLDKLHDDRHSGELAKRAMNTKLLKYGDSHYNNISKHKQTKLDRYGSETYNNPQKNFETRKLNGTCTTSKAEENLYLELCSKYGKENVIRQYEDDRYKREDGYKFKCDFYIKSNDLFIEINYWQGHGPHPFDKDNEDDLKLLANWEDKRNSGLTQYDSMIRAWTIIDPMKLNIAKKNHLNYLLLYPNCKIKI